MTDLRVRWFSRVFQCFVFPILASACCAVAFAQDAVKTDGNKLIDSDAVQKELQQFVESAAEYTILHGKTKLKLNRKPILRWTNPARANEKGGVFLWMNDGRPEAIASCFTYNNDGQAIERHEFHSLSTKPLDSSINDRPVWQPKSGIEFKPIPGAPKPATSSARRKLQLKLLARKFTAKLYSYREVNQLRLLPAPLVIYEPKRQACETGAIFSFAVGTDPEVLLLVECRDDKGDGQPVWKYGLARYHYHAVSAELNQKEVWKVGDEQQIHFADRGQFNRTRTRLYVSFDK